MGTPFLAELKIVSFNFAPKGWALCNGQLLPINPTGEEQGWSPYSAVSGMAGNPMLISPERMVKDGLVSNQDIRKFYVANSGKVNYKEASLVRDVLFEKGFRTFLTNPQTHPPFRQEHASRAYRR